MACSHKYIDDYMKAVKMGEVQACKALKQGMKLIKRQMASNCERIDAEKIEQATALIQKYFAFNLFPWQLFVLALMHAYDKNGNPVFREFLLLMGRGSGKNGFISGLSFYFLTHFHGVQGYNVDIIANSEKQATVSFNDVHSVLEQHKDVLKNFFTWNKEEIRNLKTDSCLRYHTSSPRSADSKRSGLIIADELHAYPDLKLVSTFESGLGKIPGGRIVKISTNGHIRGGALDIELERARLVLAGKASEARYCPLIFEIDSEEEAQDPLKWEKANPSLRHFPTMQAEMESMFEKMKYSAEAETEFFTKRLNFPREDRELAVASYADIKAAGDKELPDLKGAPCVGGLDYALSSDMTSAGLLFFVDGVYYWRQQSWISKHSKTLSRIKAPLEAWAERGDLIMLDDELIDPMHVAEWFLAQASEHEIKKIALDLARFPLVRQAFQTIGCDSKNTLKFVRPLDIVSVAPVIDRIFIAHEIKWGNVPIMGWATNNTKKVRMRTLNATGNYRYDKIEPLGRKNDPFMAFVAAMTQHPLLEVMEPDMLASSVVSW